MIDERILIESIMDYGGKHYVDNGMHNDDVINALDDVIKIINDQAKEMIWTPVTENTGFELKDHYWYLIVDPRYATPMKGRWHSDTYNFTYEFNGILDAISIDDVRAWMPMPQY